MKIEKITISALRGGSGKTIFTLGLISALRKKGYSVAPFKKGPDFIDAGWLSLAAEIPCYNLDAFLMTDSEIINSFINHSEVNDIAIIEGNRGLFDGLDLDGSASTAELSKLLHSPVLIIVDVTMTARTVAALIMGCQKFDPGLNIAGIILNRVAGSRQENLIKNSIERYCGIPVVGSVPKLRSNPFPERHMGLVPHQERDQARKAIEWACNIVEENLNIEEIIKLTQNPEPIQSTKGRKKVKDLLNTRYTPRIGYIKDSAFWFYYPENLELLKRLGAHLIEINSLVDRQLPELDGLYIGGGFPETRAKELATNESFRISLKEMIEKGLPVYAECGGLIYLGQELEVQGVTYPMVGALPIRFIMDARPQGHGYTILEADTENSFFRKGDTIKGHEFHYSKPVITNSEELNTVLKVVRGRGITDGRDGIVKNNLFATYTHIHAGGNKIWAESFFKRILKKIG